MQRNRGEARARGIATAALTAVALAATLAACTVENRVVVQPAPPEAPGTPDNEFRHVRITLGDPKGPSDSDCGDSAYGEVDVDPFIATIFVAGRSERPRQVRWVIDGLEEGDLLFIRPKEGSSRRLFRPETDGVFAVPGAASPSVTSGRPVQPRFEPRGKEWRWEERRIAARPHTPNPEGAAMSWAYEIEVERDGERVFFCDPEIMLERDT